MCRPITVICVDGPGTTGVADGLEAADDRLRARTVDPAGVVDALDGADCVVTGHGDGVDGLAVLAAVREEGPDVPVVCYPSDGSEELASEALAAGATDYVPHGTTEALAERVVGAVETARETARREREHERRAERLEQFASLLSHDLRNPLNVAMGRLGLVAEDCDHDQIDAVASSLDRMERLLESVVALTRLGEPVAEGERAPTDLEATVQSCWRAVDAENTTLRVETTATIDAEDGRLRRLLEELLRNAVTHGGGTVEVGNLGDDTGFYIADDGPGLPEADRDRLLEPGFAATGDGDGEGFGLSIAAEAARAHGWELRLSGSTLGGARVEVVTQ